MMLRGIRVGTAHLWLLPLACQSALEHEPAHMHGALQHSSMLPCSALSWALTTALMHPPDGRVHVLLEMA